MGQSAQAKRYAAVQNALEHDASGYARLWDDPGEAAHGSVLPLATVRSAAYGWCRDYEERISASTRQYHLVGVACRSGPGWLVLDLRSLTGA
ncbi:MAG: hypothetical protein M3Y41_15450 [Pseudomonadota bacterium]|nr:hypothetical protein [Pseudomonadota bacterium]